MPTALMVMSTLGNTTADSKVSDWITANAPDSKNILADRMNALKTYFAGLSQDVQTQNIYWSWLYTLKSLSQENLSRDGYPNFMKNDDWNKKICNAHSDHGQSSSTIPSFMPNNPMRN